MQAHRIAFALLLLVASCSASEFRLATTNRWFSINHSYQVGVPADESVKDKPEVNFYLSGSKYFTLGTVDTASCDDGWTVMSDGNGSWSCAGGDTLQNLCSTSDGVPVVQVSGTTSSWACGTDSDVVNNLGCTEGSIYTVDSDGVLQCDTEADTYAGLTCSSTQYPCYENNMWVCKDQDDVPLHSDDDTLSSLSCPSGTAIPPLARKSATGFECVMDSDVLREAVLGSCTAGQFLKANGDGTWRCEDDSADSGPTCSDTMPYPKWDHANGVWVCTDEFFADPPMAKRDIENVENTVLPNTIVVSPSVHSVSSVADANSEYAISYAGDSQAPYVFPAPGVINRGYVTVSRAPFQGDGMLTATLAVTVNGQSMATYGRFEATYPHGSTNEGTDAFTEPLVHDMHLDSNEPIQFDAGDRIGLQFSMVESNTPPGGAAPKFETPDGTVSHYYLEAFLYLSLNYTIPITDDAGK